MITGLTSNFALNGSGDKPLGLVLFGALLLAGNTVPAQLSKLSLPLVRRLQENESDSSPSKDEGKRFFFTTLICGAFLFVTGLILKLL